MSSNNSLLEVDRSIIEKNLLITGANDSEFNSLLDNITKKDEVPSKLVKPSPGFCVKFRSKDEEKIFVNVCHTDALPEPEDISEDALNEILTSDTRSNYRIPMSIGEGHTVSDTSGNPALAFDIAIHTNFLKKIEKSLPFKEFFIAVVLEALENKYKVAIDREKFIILKNKKCVGSLHTHRIQQREVNREMGIKPKPLIEELDDITIPRTQAKDEKPSITKTICHPDYRLIREPKEGDLKYVIGEFKVPEIMSIKDVTLDVGEDRIVLVAKRPSYYLDIFLPYLINQEYVAAEFNNITKVITVKMPVVEAS